MKHTVHSWKEALSKEGIEGNFLNLIEGVYIKKFPYNKYHTDWWNMDCFPSVVRIRMGCSRLALLLITSKWSKSEKKQWRIKLLEMNTFKSQYSQANDNLRRKSYRTYRKLLNLLSGSGELLDTSTVYKNQLWTRNQWSQNKNREHLKIPFKALNTWE